MLCWPQNAARRAASSKLCATPLATAAGTLHGVASWLNGANCPATRKMAVISDHEEMQPAQNGTQASRCFWLPFGQASRARKSFRPGSPRPLTQVRTGFMTLASQKRCFRRRAWALAAQTASFDARCVVCLRGEQQAPSRPEGRRCQFHRAGKPLLTAPSSARRLTQRCAAPMRCSKEAPGAEVRGEGRGARWLAI